jgi:hypothetical protein
MSLLCLPAWCALYFRMYYITPQSIIIAVLFVAAMYIFNSLGKK